MQDLQQPAGFLEGEHASNDFARLEVQLANRNSGTLLEMLRHDVTPVGLHYLLNHFDVPYVTDAETWRLTVGGMVERELSLGLADLQAMPQKTLRVTMECAGNGRANVEPRWKSQPWMYEAVGTSEWTGTPLRGVLEKAGLSKDCVDVVFLGIDRGLDKGNEHAYGRSLKPAAALHKDVLVVWAMNGMPLLPQHGFPLRLIVPGWYGMASVKWMNRIEAWDRAYDGHQQIGTYIYKEKREETGTPVTTIRVKSLMVPPGIPDWYTRNRFVDAGRVTIHGRAWSGAGVPIANVELGIDDRWMAAELAQAAGKYAWRGWSFNWDAKPGTYVLSCRATDAEGETQPLSPRWDVAGFGNNYVHRIKVTVR